MRKPKLIQRAVRTNGAAIERAVALHGMQPGESRGWDSASAFTALRYRES